MTAIRLKKLDESALEKVMCWRMLPEVTKYMYTDPILTLPAQRAWYKKISGDPTVKYWLIEVDKRQIGVINLADMDPVNLRCYWGHYLADASYRGSGLWAILECNIYDYVFNVLNFNKLGCEVFYFNERAINAHKKCGAEIEGVLKQHVRKKGQFFDVVVMAILKEKWFKIKNNYVYEKIAIE